MNLHYVFDTDYQSRVTCLPITANSNLRNRFLTILVTEFIDEITKTRSYRRSGRKAFPNVGGTPPQLSH